MQLKKENIGFILLLIFYSVGLTGTLFWDESVLKLTPVNLLISLGIVLWFHQEYDARFLLYAIIVFVNGFLLEWIGVTTGKVFGVYFYGNNLGYKLFDIPVVIGINWLMLSYSSMNVAQLLIQRANLLKYKEWLWPFIGAVLMVAVDIWIEQVCSRLDFWYWKDQVVPLQNYTAWFLFSFAFNYLFVKMEVKTGNKVAMLLYLLQLLFFIGLNLGLH